MIRYKGAHDLPDLAFSTGTTLAGKTSGWRNLRPVLMEKSGPCIGACPANVPIPHYITALRQGNMDEAVRIILTRNPFPSITGRVCPHYCEVGCNRKRLDEAVSIRAIERFMGDYALEKKGAPPGKETGKTVGIVGSGPAGLTAAYYLRKLGHTVVVYERSQIPGGVLREGIPAYRLPPMIVDKEIESLKRMGILFQLGVEVGNGRHPVDALMKQHNAVFFAIGAHQEQEMKIPGEDLFISGLRFLEEVAHGRREPPGERVAVIGGGNVAMDVARTLLRLGATPTILYRRTEKEMPALQEELKRAREDGIEFLFLTTPVSAEKVYNWIVLKMVKMQLGEKDKSGRPRPVPVPGSEYELHFDAVIKAVGEYPDTSIFPSEALNEKGWLIVNKNTGATPVRGLFAGGDLVDGPSTVVEAIAWGRKSAFAIDAFFRGETVAGEEKLPKTVPYKAINFDYFLQTPGHKQLEIPVAKRIHTYLQEEVGGLTFQEVLAEASRCFSCGHCNACGNCWLFCPDAAIDWTDNAPLINYDFCKGCGICAVECPRSVITLVEEVPGRAGGKDV